MHKLWIQSKLLRGHVEISVALEGFAGMSVGFRILFIANFHQHESKRCGISKFLTYDGVKVRVCFRRVVGSIDEDLRHFRKVD
jgi:hypothetical protein